MRFLICILFKRHPQPDPARPRAADFWSPWQHAGRGHFFRTRICRRCGTLLTERDPE